MPPDNNDNVDDSLHPPESSPQNKQVWTITDRFSGEIINDVEEMDFLNFSVPYKTKPYPVKR